MTDREEQVSAPQPVPTVRRLCMGNEAIALAAIAAGVNVACGYPGTPSTEIVETIARNNADHAIHVEWSTNEKAALEVAAGASYSGARVIMTCKQVGLNVASDPLMSLAYVGTRGGLVIVAADDPGPISSQTEQDTRQFGQFAHVPVLDPASPEEAYEMTIAAFDLSERYGCPVILRPTTRVDHGCASLQVPADLAAIPRHEIDGFQKDPRWVIFPPLSRAAHGRMAADLRAIAEEFSQSPFNSLTTWGDEDADWDDAYLGIACGGDSRGYVREALARLRDIACERETALPPVRLLEVGTPFPFPMELGRRFLNGLAEALCVEELEPVIERELVALGGPLAIESHPLTCPPDVHGRLDETTPVAGEYSSDLLLPIIARFLGVEDLLAPAEGDESAAAPVPPASLVPPRPPVLCAGCPHRASFMAVRSAVGRRPCVYTGDIGCYTLGCNKPLNATDTCLCMGAGVTISQGIGVADRLRGDCETLHVGFVGDSTFFASAMTGLANAVYNQHRMVLCVLDNSTTAMTGSQPNPNTGVTLMGAQSKPISIPDVCRALGCDFVEVVDPLDFEAAVEAAGRALECDGVAVIVFRSPCVQLFRALPPVEIDAAKCRGCNACVRNTGCPALSMVFPKAWSKRAVAQVDASLCAGCDLCVGQCRFGAIASPRKGMPAAERDAARREAFRG